MTPRHNAVVRVTHWLTTLCFLALLVTGVNILISHPRYYWGEDGHSQMEPLFQIPIPASRGHVPTGYNYTLPDQNGWSRSLHFQAGWIAFFTGVVYLVSGLRRKHFQRKLLPAAGQFAELPATLKHHLTLRRPTGDTYNIVQRLTYLTVIFVLAPLTVWTGLAMSPALIGAYPTLLTVFGGQQSARTLHFFLTLALVAFVLVHVAMIARAGFTSRVRAMIKESA